MKHQHTELYKLLQKCLRELSTLYEQTRKATSEIAEVFEAQAVLWKKIARKQRNYQRYLRQYKNGGERKKSRVTSKN